MIVLVIATIAIPSCRYEGGEVGYDTLLPGAGRRKPRSRQGAEGGEEGAEAGRAPGGSGLFEEVPLTRRSLAPSYSYKLKVMTGDVRNAGLGNTDVSGRDEARIGRRMGASISSEELAAARCRTCHDCVEGHTLSFPCAYHLMHALPGPALFILVARCSLLRWGVP